MNAVPDQPPNKQTVEELPVVRVDGRLDQIRQGSEEIAAGVAGDSVRNPACSDGASDAPAAASARAADKRCSAAFIRGDLQSGLSGVTTPLIDRPSLKT